MHGSDIMRVLGLITIIQHQPARIQNYNNTPDDAETHGDDIEENGIFSNVISPEQ